MLSYIVSLTTIPSKFNNLYKTIDSIVSQTIIPIKIIINIPKKYTFRFQGSEISEDQLNNFKLKYTKHNVFVNLIDNDYGPGTKLLGLLDSDMLNRFAPCNGIFPCMACENTYIILIDDDLIYKPNMIEEFDKEIKASAISVASFCVYINHTIEMAQGADGLLIKLSKLHRFNYKKSFYEYYQVIKNEDYIGFHDDFYISYYFYLMKENIHSMKQVNNCCIYDTHSGTLIDTLAHLEGKYSRKLITSKIFEILEGLKLKGYFNFLMESI